MSFVDPDLPAPTGTAGPDLLELELAEVTPGPAAGRTGPVTVVPPVPEPSAAPEPGWPGPVPSNGTAGRFDARYDTAAPAVIAPTAQPGPQLPGSAGEHLLQQVHGTAERAQRFYDEQLLDRLNEQMIEFIGRMPMAFVATSDASGECDCSLRAGPPGFIQVLGEREVAYPEYRGNGVLASLGNVSENPNIGILLVDFVRDLIGLHVNGHARIVADEDLRAEHPDLPVDGEHGRVPERWVVVSVVEAYIHCRKHIPRMVPAERARSWGTDDPIPKGGDYFAAKGAPRPWHQPAAHPVAAGSGPVTSGANGHRR